MILKILNNFGTGVNYSEWISAIMLRRLSPERFGAGPRDVGVPWSSPAVGGNAWDLGP